jgi:hypothetical protein
MSMPFSWKNSIICDLFLKRYPSTAMIVYESPAYKFLWKNNQKQAKLICHIRNNLSE